MNGNGNCGCELNAPYPPVKVERENRSYAALLSDVYAGYGSECTAVNQYFYQHLILYSENEELADSLECISIVEMRHMEFLGRLIVQLGGDPQIGSVRRRRFNYWSGRYPKYFTSEREILEADIAGEEAAVAEYRRLQEAIDDAYIKRVLERIIADEEHHIKIFKKYLGKI